MAIAKSRTWTIEALMDLSRDEVIELWKTLPAADVRELVGEFGGYIPLKGADEDTRRRTADVMYNESSPRGYWLGKAYEPTGDGKGRGYNVWRRLGGKIVRDLLFSTEMGTSLIDGRPALMMYYGAYNEGNTLTDEIRKLDDGLFVGVGTTAVGDRRTPPGHFVLVGPIHDYIGPDEGWKVEPWTLGRLMRLNREQVLDLWKTLPAAQVREMEGEFAGYVPTGRDAEAKRRVDEMMYDESSIRGYWFGKAYKPTGETTGDGYNVWRRLGGRMVRDLRFATEMGTSLIDGKPSLLMYYGAYRNRAGDRDLIDEIRKLADGLYVGLGAARNPDGTRSAPGHFILAGPIGEWVGADDATAELK